MIMAICYLAGGLYCWYKPGAIVRIFSCVFLFCGVLASLLIVGAVQS